MEKKSKAFKDFLSYFPLVEMPLTVQDSDHHTYSANNDPLPDILLTAYITPHLPFETDEFTEFLPCFQFVHKPNMHHLILWTARLMHYSYYLFNFDGEGNFLACKEVAGFYASGNMVNHKMARIDEEGSIFIVEGGMQDGHHDFDPSDTKKWELDIGDDGQIIEFRL